MTTATSTFVSGSTNVTVVRAVVKVNVAEWQSDAEDTTTPECSELLNVRPENTPSQATNIADTVENTRESDCPVRGGPSQCRRAAVARRGHFGARVFDVQRLGQTPLTTNRARTEKKDSNRQDDVLKHIRLGRHQSEPRNRTVGVPEKPEDDDHWMVGETRRRVTNVKAVSYLSMYSTGLVPALCVS